MMLPERTGKILVLIFSAILVLLFILIVGLSWYFFDVKGGSKNNSTTAKETSSVDSIKQTDSLDLSNKDPEVGGVVEKVSRHLLLPAKDFTVATVKDETVLWKDNPVLFGYMRNGQKLLLYDTGVIVYDPVLDKIVDVVQFYNARQQKLSN